MWIKWPTQGSTCHFRVSKTLLDAENIKLFRILDADTIRYHNKVLDTNTTHLRTFHKKSLNKEDAVDRCKWRKVIKEVRLPGWV